MRLLGGYTSEHGSVKVCASRQRLILRLVVLFDGPPSIHVQSIIPFAREISAPVQLAEDGGRMTYVIPVNLSPRLARSKHGKRLVTNQHGRAIIPVTENDARCCADGLRHSRSGRANASRPIDNVIVAGQFGNGRRSGNNCFLSTRIGLHGSFSKWILTGMLEWQAQSGSF
jgi:hypothetical protein